MKKMVNILLVVALLLTVISPLQTIVISRAYTVTVVDKNISLGTGETSTISLLNSYGVTIKKATYKSKNKKIASVSKNGVVKGKSVGKTTVVIKVKYKKKKKTGKKTIKVKVDVFYKEKPKAPGLYADDGTLVYSWDELRARQRINISGGDYEATIESASDTLEGSLYIPDGVVEIGDEAFEKCGKLTHVYLPESVSRIGNNAFYGCSSLQSINMPSTINLGVIGGGAFWGCSCLAGIVIPESVTEIGGGAFIGCGSITEINIPKKVTSIGYYKFERGLEYSGLNPYPLFSGCNQLKKLTVDKDNLIYDSRDGCNAIIETDHSVLLSATFGTTSIPDTVTGISNKAFSGIYIDRFVVPSGLDVWGKQIDAKCIVLPDGIEKIPSKAFSGCGYLVDSIIIPDSVKEIGSNLFSSDNYLTQIYIPISVENIDSGAFSFDQDVDVYCGVKEKPEGWSDKWYTDSRYDDYVVNIHWGVTREEYNRIISSQENVSE